MDHTYLENGIRHNYSRRPARRIEMKHKATNAMKFLRDLYKEVIEEYARDSIIIQSKGESIIPDGTIISVEGNTIVRYDIDKDVPEGSLKLVVITGGLYQSFLIEKDDFKDHYKTMRYCMRVIGHAFESIEFESWLLGNCFKDGVIMSPQAIGELLFEESDDFDSIVSKFVIVIGDEYSRSYNLRLPYFLDKPVSKRSIYCKSSFEIGGVIHKYFRDEFSGKEEMVR